MTGNENTNPGLDSNNLNNDSAEFDNVLSIFKHKNFKPSLPPLSDVDSSTPESLPESLSSKIVTPNKDGGFDFSQFEITDYKAPEFSPVLNAPAPSSPPATQSFEELRQNIHELKGLHQKLKFMLKELEDLVASE